MADCGPLVGVDRRQDLQYFAPEAGPETCLPGLIGGPLELSSRGLLVVDSPVVERDGETLVLDRPADGLGERVNRVAVALRFRVELEPVQTDVGHSLDADEPLRILSNPAADARDERVARGEPLELRL